MCTAQDENGFRQRDAYHRRKKPSIHSTLKLNWCLDANLRIYEFSILFFFLLFLSSPLPLSLPPSLLNIWLLRCSLELTMWPRLASNSWSFCLSLWGAKITNLLLHPNFNYSTQIGLCDLTTVHSYLSTNFIFYNIISFSDSVYLTGYSYCF